MFFNLSFYFPLLFLSGRRNILAARGNETRVQSRSSPRIRGSRDAWTRGPRLKYFSSSRGSTATESPRAHGRRISFSYRTQRPANTRWLRIYVFLTAGRARLAAAISWIIGRNIFEITAIVIFYCNSNIGFYSRAIGELVRGVRASRERSVKWFWLSGSER